MDDFADAENLPTQLPNSADHLPPMLRDKPEISPIGLDEYELFCCDVEPITEIPEEWLNPELRDKYKGLLEYYKIAGGSKEGSSSRSFRERLIKVIEDPKAAAQSRNEVEKIIEELRNNQALSDDIDFTDYNFVAIVRSHPQLAKEIIVSKIARDYPTAELLCFALAEMDIEVQAVETIYGVAVRCSEMGQTIPSDLLGIWISRNIAACEAVLEDPYRASRLVRMFCGLIIGLLTCKNPVTKELFNRATELKFFSIKFSGFKEAGSMFQHLSTMMGHKLS